MNTLTKHGPGDPNGLQKQFYRRGAFNSPMILKLAKRMAKDIRLGRGGERVPEPKATTLRELYDLNVKYGDAVLAYPHHLQPYLDVLEAAMVTPQDVCVSAPPQHHKTTTTLMALAFALLRHDDKEHFYITYSGKRAIDVCADFAHLLERLGIRHAVAGGVVSCKGNTVRFVSLDQGITGYSCNGLCIVDDPVKNPQEARSSTMRDNVWRGFNQNILSRKTGKMSVVVMCTRWDTDDLIGRLAAKGVRYINLKAICDDDDSTPEDERDPLGRRPGTPLLWSIPDPGRDVRDNDERAWFAMYQGEPAPEGMRIFEAEATYTELPRTPLVVLYGLDSAYAAKVSSDWSVCVRCLLNPADGKVYVDRVIRRQVPLDRFGKEVAELQRRRNGPIVWFTGGQEQYAAADVLRREGVRRLECVTARGQLRIRASRVSAAWNAGRILVPANQDTAMQQFVEEVTSFTGDNKAHDDCVAALHGAVHAALSRTSTSLVNSIIKPDPVTQAREVGAASLRAYERRLDARNTTRNVAYVRN